MIRKIDLIPSYLKFIMGVGFDLLALSIAFFLAYFIRMGLNNTAFTLSELYVYLTITLSTLILFTYFDVYRSVVRYFNAKAFLKIFIILICTTAIFYLAGYIFDAFIPRSVPIVFFVLAILQITSVRALFGIIFEKNLFNEREGVVIYGASTTGRELVNALTLGKKYQPLAFIDEKARYQNRNVLGLHVYSHKKIGNLLKRFGKFKVLIAVSNVDPHRLKEIVTALEPHALELLTVPTMSDMVSGKRSIDQLREISVKELLGRKSVKPVPELLSANVTNKVVMVSGAGGSIGKELCRQILLNTPKKLVLLDISEAFLYEIHQELTELLAETNNPLEIVPLIGNVQNDALMKFIFNQQQVQTIYHAAAYKHVPMVEGNVIAGVSNNVFGTYAIAKAAVASKVETFVLISTDKAVRPTNVMGATKRMAELVLQGLANKQGETRFAMVRFGNVLGSSGSVVPLFKKQIERGGPITITHPDIIRYFMTIPEAAQLVIQAGAMGKGGDVFVLDMGSPVKIVDLAHKMTHLMGFTIKNDDNPMGDIAIEYSGLRPGEKLYEELLIDDHAQQTSHERILTANEKSIPWDDVITILEHLTQAITNEDDKQIRQILLNAPLGYNPSTAKQKEQTLSQFTDTPSILEPKIPEPELIGAV
ncbi:polysaccharide biosynthesis protein [Colwellia sp. RE-S-Sl-9]